MPIPFDTVAALEAFLRNFFPGFVLTEDPRTGEFIVRLGLKRDVDSPRKVSIYYADKLDVMVNPDKVVSHEDKRLGRVF